MVLVLVTMGMGLSFMLVPFRMRRVCEPALMTSAMSWPGTVAT